MWALVIWRISSKNRTQKISNPNIFAPLEQRLVGSKKFFIEWSDQPPIIKPPVQLGCGALGKMTMGGATRDLAKTGQPLEDGMWFRIATDSMMNHHPIPISWVFLPHFDSDTVCSSGASFFGVFTVPT